MQKCLSCASPYGYEVNENLYACPECAFEWNPTEAQEEDQEEVVKDANGSILQNGDDVVIIKDLPVKGASKPIKAGTKVKNIRLTDGDHNIQKAFELFFFA